MLPCCLIVKSCLTLWDLTDCSTSGFPVLHYLLPFAQTHVHCVRDAIQPSQSSPSPAFNLSQHQGLFQKKSALPIRLAKYCSFSFGISPSNEYPRLISFRIDSFDLLAVQGTLKSFLQHHNLKASVLQLSSSLWSNYHIHTWSLEKIIALTIWILLVKWCLHLLIHCLSLSYFQPKEQASSKFMAAVTVHSDFRAQENRICHCFHCFPI